MLLPSFNVIGFFTNTLRPNNVMLEEMQAAPGSTGQQKEPTLYLVRSEFYEAIA
jgi:hypothetical protein